MRADETHDLDSLFRIRNKANCLGLTGNSGSSGEMTTTRSGPTIDRLRHDIDAGHTRDKVAWPDPAAAPLGTDEECAGTPVQEDHVAQAHAAERARLPDGWRRPRPIGGWILATFIVAFAAAMIMASKMS